jgi:hypothetical protein
MGFSWQTALRLLSQNQIDNAVAVAVSLKAVFIGLTVRSRGNSLPGFPKVEVMAALLFVLSITESCPLQAALFLTFV